MTTREAAGRSAHRTLFGCGVLLGLGVLVALSRFWWPVARNQFPVVGHRVFIAQTDYLSVLQDLQAQGIRGDTGDLLREAVRKAKSPDTLLVLPSHVLLGGSGVFCISEPAPLKDSSGTVQFFHELWGGALDGANRRRGGLPGGWGTLLREILSPQNVVIAQAVENEGTSADVSDSVRSPSDDVRVAASQLVRDLDHIDWSRNIAESEWLADLVRGVDGWTIVCFPRFIGDVAGDHQLMGAMIIAGPDRILVPSHRLFREPQKYLVATWLRMPPSSGPQVEGPKEVTWSELVSIAAQQLAHMEQVHR